MTTALLAQFGIPVLARIISEALGGIDHPAAKGAAKALEELNGLAAAGAISAEQMAEANRHVERMTELEAGNIGQVNESLRAEAASEDKYVRRMRPTFGYMMAFTWAAQMFGIAYIIVFRTGEAAVVLQAVQSLSAIWAMGLSVLGVYVYKRSAEKQADGEKEIIFWEGRRRDGTR